MALVFCPHCGKTHKRGTTCPCRAAAKPKRRPTAGDATRGEREPWRREYGRQEYGAARQLAITQQQGRCLDCGAKVAMRDGSGRWTTQGLGGEVHHKVALCDGGGNDAGNLVLLCQSCHAKRDAERRRHG